jgi:hypothetical protein
MAIVHITGSDATNTASPLVTVGTALTAGDTIIVSVYSGSGTGITFTATDNGAAGGTSNTYIQDAVKSLSTDGDTIAVLHADNISVAGTTTPLITIVPSAGGTGALRLAVSAYSGLALSSFDKTNGTNATGLSPDSGPSGTLSQANELILGVVGNDNTPTSVTQGSGFAIRNTVLNAGKPIFVTEDQVVAVNSSIDATFSQSPTAEYACIVCTYRGAATNNQGPGATGNANYQWGGGEGNF